MNTVTWVFIEKPAQDNRREWQMRNPADAGQVFYCYAERIKRRDGSEHWRRRYGRTSAAPDLTIAAMEEMFRAAHERSKHDG